MKKTLFLLSAFLIFACKETNSKSDEVTAKNIEPIIEKVEQTIESKITNALSENEKKELFNLIVTAQDRATNEAKIAVPDNYKWEERVDIERELQSKYELEVYKKQSWWIEINEDVKIANKIRNNISKIGLKSGWLN
jgi:predicted NBD/HSP70 family sugar kinase